MKSQVFILLVFFWSADLLAQDKADAQQIKSKRFISKVEILVGPSLLLNYGNKFIENYKSPFFNNVREPKVGYSIGAGVHHPIKSWIDINVRLLWERKGTRSKFTTAPRDTSATHHLVQTVESEYAYIYLTLSFIPIIFLDKKQKTALLVGGYYSEIKGVNARTSWAWHNDNNNGFSAQSFHGKEVIGIDVDGGVTSFGIAQGLSGFQKADYGVILGFGYSISLAKSQSITLQLIENFGLQNVNKQVFGPSLMNSPERNNTLCLMIGYVYQRPGKKYFNH